MIVSQFRSIFIFRSEAPKYGIVPNSFSDLYITAVAMCFIFVYRLIAYRHALPKVEARMKIIDPQCTEKQVYKITRCRVGLMWYGFQTIYGIYLFYDHPYVPTLFFGRCKCKEIAAFWPRHETTSDIRRFYMIVFAHHLYSLIELLLEYRKRFDAAEMLLHHIATVSIMIFSYFTNNVASGITVLTAHNIGDVFANLVKYSRDVKLMKGFMLDLLAVSFFCSWVLPRVFLMSMCVLPAVIYTRFFEEGIYDVDIQPLVYQMNSFDVVVAVILSTIVLLNVYWSLLFGKMIYSRVLGSGNFEAKGQKAH